MIIAIDFDGTLAETLPMSLFPKCGKPLPGAIDGVMALHAAGHQLILWTCRCGQKDGWVKPDPSLDSLQPALEWLKEHDIYQCFSAFNDDNYKILDGYGISRKIAAEVFIDDRMMGGFPGWSWVMATMGSMCLL